MPRTAIVERQPLVQSQLQTVTQPELAIWEALRRNYNPTPHGSHDKIEPFADDIAFIKRLHSYRRLAGIEFDTQEEKAEGKIAYDFVLDVRTVANGRRGGTFNERETKEGIKDNLITNLFERHGADKGKPFTYRIKKGKLYSEYFEKPFVEVIQLGKTWLESQESPTQLLEDQERVGYERLEQLALQGENNQIVFLLSPRCGERYYMNVFDGFLLNVNEATTNDTPEQQRVLHGTRFTHKDVTDDDYYRIAETFDPTYFDDLPYFIEEHKEIYETDQEIIFKAYCRSKPIPVPQRFGNTPQEVFENVVKKIDEEKQKEKEAIVTACMPFIHAYINVLCEVSDENFYKNANYWRATGLAFQSILSFSEEFQKEYQKDEKKDNVEAIAMRVRRRKSATRHTASEERKIHTYFREYPSNTNNFHNFVPNTTNPQMFPLSGGIPLGGNELYNFGTTRVEQKPAPCGGSSGLKFGEEEGENNDIASVSSSLRRMNNRIDNKFNFLKKEKSNSKTEWFKCPKCGWEADGPIGDGPCGGCGLTKDDYIAANPEKACA